MFIGTIDIAIRSREYSPVRRTIESKWNEKRELVVDLNYLCARSFDTQKQPIYFIIYGKFTRSPLRLEFLRECNNVTHLVREETIAACSDAITSIDRRRKEKVIAGAWIGFCRGEDEISRDYLCQWHGNVCAVVYPEIERLSLGLTKSSFKVIPAIARDKLNRRFSDPVKCESKASVKA